VDDTIYIPRHRLDVGEMADLAFRKGWRRVVLYAVLVSGLLGFINYNFFAPAFGLSVPIVVSISVLIALLTILQSRRTTKGILSKQAQSLAFEDRTIHFNRRSITVDYAGGATSTFPWTCFVKAEWGPEMLLIYITGIQYVTIPRRYLDSNSETAIKNALDTAKQQKGLLAPPPLA
jgi:hypothetical protein